MAQKSSRNNKPQGSTNKSKRIHDLPPNAIRKSDHGITDESSSENRLLLVPA